MSGPFGSTAWMANPASGFYDFEISNSLRFEDGDSAYLNFTPSSAGNRKTWTWSSWVKRGNLGLRSIFSAYGGTANDALLAVIKFDASDRLTFDATTFNFLRTNRVFRDPSAWYHIVLAFDTTNATAANRVRMYINGVEETSFSARTNPSEDADHGINGNYAHDIGRNTYQDTTYYDGYLADVNFIDGAALTPSSFGETKNDIWIPKDTSGLTFGDQGWRLQFKQVGTGTASTSTIGADTSGETNHWTSNNLVASDVVPDSPTNNFATYNAVDNPEGATLSEGNLKCTSADAAYEVVLGTIPFSSGKYYWEQNATSGNAIDLLGVATTAIDPDVRANNLGVGIHSVAYYAGNGGNGGIYWNSVGHQDGLAGWGAGDVMSLACDMDNKTIQFRKNNVLIYTASSDANGNITNTWNDMIPAWSIGSGVADKHSVVNFGQDSSFAGQETAQGNADENGIGDFYYAPPSGYLALCTSNLPDPVETIDPNKGGSPQDYFNTVLYTGNGATTHAISGVGFQPDWVWGKRRSGVNTHWLFDSVRGATEQIESDTTNDESTQGTMLKTFDSDGFSMGNDNPGNKNTETYVAWNWKTGTAFSNDASSTSVGSIDSAGSVNTDVGFSIIGYTGAGGTSTVAHGLGVVPEMLIVKARSQDGENWAVYNANLSAPAQNTLFLNTAGAEGTSTAVWNNTGPTSSVFTVGNAGVNNDTSTYIAYCFASVDGYSKFGSYEGNGNADGPFVYTGFRPAYIVIKCSSASGRSWIIKDSARDIDNVAGNTLLADASDAEYTSNTLIDIISNGFKPRDTSTSSNADGSTYIYMAFAEQPFKYANAR